MTVRVIEPGEECPAEVHLHRVWPQLALVSGWLIAGDGVDRLVTGDREVAERVAVLLERYGLVDVPDTVAALCPWPAPDPRGRVG